MIRASVGTRKIDILKSPDKVIESAESIATGFSSIFMRFTPILFEKYGKNVIFLTFLFEFFFEQ